MQQNVDINIIFNSISVHQVSQIPKKSVVVETELIQFFKVS